MEHRVMPWWMGYFLINPFRKYWHNPDQLLGKFIQPGMSVVDYGCAMGFFSLAMARLIGTSGKVYCFDVQKKMIDKLLQRAGKAGLNQLIETRLVTGDSNIFNDLQETMDFELLFAVAHEVSDRADLFNKLYLMMKPGGRLLFAEPTGHVSKEEFIQSVALAEDSGFIQVEKLTIKNSHAVLLKKVLANKNTT